jgi:hypothetical protein
MVVLNSWPILSATFSAAGKRCIDTALNERQIFDSQLVIEIASNSLAVRSEGQL